MKNSSIIPVVVTLGAVVLAGTVVTYVQKAPAVSSLKADSQPASVTALPGFEFPAITLTPRAAERLGVTSAVIENPLTVPYAAVLYDAQGKTWVYTNPKELTYVRHGIEVDRITEEQAFLLRGPAAGEAVVTTGAAELLGIEFGVGK